MSSAYLRLLIFLPAILIPACASSSPAFLMMYSAFKLNKLGDNIQPWHTPFPVWNQSLSQCLGSGFAKCDTFENLEKVSFLPRHQHFSFFLLFLNMSACSIRICKKSQCVPLYLIQIRGMHSTSEEAGKCHYQDPFYHPCTTAQVKEYFEMHLSENTSRCPLTPWSDDSSHDSLWNGQVNLQKIYSVVRHTCPLKSLPLAVHWADPSLETSVSQAEQWSVALTVRVWTCEEFDALSFSISDAFSCLSLLFSQILRQRLCCRQLIWEVILREERVIQRGVGVLSLGRGLSSVSVPFRTIREGQSPQSTSTLAPVAQWFKAPWSLPCLASLGCR